MCGFLCGEMGEQCLQRGDSMGPEGRAWRCGEASGKRREMLEAVAGEAGRARSRRDLCAVGDCLDMIL